MVHPYEKDIKGGMKEIIYFKPESYKTPFFSEYYIVTPLKNKKRIKVTAEIFQSIHNTAIASITCAPHSSFVFEVEVGKKEMTFNETNEPLDIKENPRFKTRDHKTLKTFNYFLEGHHVPEVLVRSDLSMS